MENSQTSDSLHNTTKTLQPATKVHRDEPTQVTEATAPAEDTPTSIPPHTPTPLHTQPSNPAADPSTSSTVTTTLQPASLSSQHRQPPVHYSLNPTGPSSSSSQQQAFNMATMQHTLPPTTIYQHRTPRHLLSPLPPQPLQQRYPNPSQAAPLAYPSPMQHYQPSPIPVPGSADHSQAYYATGYQTAPYVQTYDGYGYGNQMVIQQPEYQQTITYPVSYSSSYPPQHQTWHQQPQPHQPPASWYYPQHMPASGYGHPPSPQAPHGPSMQSHTYHTSPALRRNSGPVQAQPAGQNQTESQRVSPPQGKPGDSLPRGPPRKPKKSGNGLWVGNLPPGTTVGELKEYFSQGAKTEIQSVYLISKSNCAFINYHNDAALTDAMGRFHDSRFKNTRLVCRTQRPETEKFLGASQTPPRKPSPASADEAEGTPPTAKAPPSGPSGALSRPRVYGKDRYFIVKSLTVEDMDFSVKNGIWATQGHNENTLNEAFQTAENVYLIFSANKSGEYFGYARMTSAITSRGSSPTLGLPAQYLPSSLASPSTPTAVPTAIITPETESAPKGCIYDDSARGSIFWEADTEPGTHPDTAGDDAEPNVVPATAGKPFTVQWISMQRLPFYRCRNLRNPWNANREVKVARDGTELETALGGRLLTMFQRAGG